MNKNNYEPTAREKKVHHWKLAMRDGDIGLAAMLKKELEKDRPAPVVAEEIDTTVKKEETVAVKQVKRGKRGRPRKK